MPSPRTIPLRRSRMLRFRPGVRIERPVAVSVLAFIGILAGSALLFCNAIAMVADTDSC